MTTPHDSTGIDALVRAIEALQERIRNDGDTIGSNEIRTRTALVDPLLTALGWDTTDPAMVIPEYAAGGGTADYALLKVTPDDGSPVIAFVEAKRLHEPLEPHRAQMLTYANMSGVKYAGLTNGDRWELYEVFKEAPLHERRIVDVSLRRERAFDCAVQLLPLQWPSLETGEVLSKENATNLLAQALESNAAPSIIASLLNGGASLRAWNKYGWTPLHAAAMRCKNPEVINVLIQYGADIDARIEDGWTPLHVAAANNTRTSIVSMLLDRGASVEAFTDEGWTPLHLAASKNTEPVAISLLLNRGADIKAANDGGWTPLHLAAAESTEPAVISLLLDHGADIEATTNDGWCSNFEGRCTPCSDRLAAARRPLPWGEASRVPSSKRGRGLG